MLWREAAGLLLGAIAGSFIATVLIRWPQGRSPLSGRSACDRCGAPLRAFELVPIVSHVALKGRCRRCGADIDRRHLAIELAAAMMGAVALLAHPLPLAFATALLGWWLLLIALLDLEHHWLPDLLTLPLLAAGLALAWAGLGPSLAEAAAGAAAGYLGLEALRQGYRRLRGREGMGGGDPKLAAALGAWLGIFQLPFLLVGAGLVGLAMAALLRARGEEVGATTRLPLGTLLALAGWPLWILVAA